MTSTAVVILNFNGEQLLRKFLPSVVKHSPHAQIVVADNGSTDNSLSMLKEEFPGVRCLDLGENYGFCGGYNRALKQIEADYFVLLNSDVEVTAGWLTPLEGILNNETAVAAVQPKILSYNQKSMFEYAGAGGGFIDTLGYPFCRGRLFDQLEADHGQYDDIREVFWASGACMMVRAKAWHHFGGLDEDFFAHMEEIDLCWQFQRAGMKICYCGRSKVFHLGAGTLGYDNPRKTYLNFRNGLSLIIKHLDPGECLVKIPARIVLDWIAAMVFLAKGSARNFLAVFRAHAYVVRHAGKLLRKRRRLRAAYPAYPRNNVHRGLIVFSYYLRKKKRSPVQ